MKTGVLECPSNSKLFSALKPSRLRGSSSVNLVIFVTVESVLGPGQFLLSIFNFNRLNLPDYLIERDMLNLKWSRRIITCKGI